MAGPVEQQTRTCSNWLSSSPCRSGCWPFSPDGWGPRAWLGLSSSRLDRTIYPTPIQSVQTPVHQRGKPTRLATQATDFQTDRSALSVGAAAGPSHQPGRSPCMAGPVEQLTWSKQLSTQSCRCYHRAHRRGFRVWGPKQPTSAPTIQHSLLVLLSGSGPSSRLHPDQPALAIAESARPGLHIAMTWALLDSYSLSSTWFWIYLISGFVSSSPPRVRRIPSELCIQTVTGTEDRTLALRQCSGDCDKIASLTMILAPPNSWIQYPHKVYIHLSGWGQLDISKTMSDIVENWDIALKIS